MKSEGRVPEAIQSLLTAPVARERNGEEDNDRSLRHGKEGEMWLQGFVSFCFVLLRNSSHCVVFEAIRPHLTSLVTF